MNGPLLSALNSNLSPVCATLNRVIVCCIFDFFKMLLMFLNSAGSWNSYNIVQPQDIGLPQGLKANMGWAVAAVDDANGDGIQDVAVSNIGEDEATSPFPEGAVHVVALFRSGAVKDWRTFNGTRFGVKPGGRFGRALAAVGDWVGEGSSIGGGGVGGGSSVEVSVDEHDLLVGAPGHLSGCVFLLRPGVPLFGDAATPRLCGADVVAAGITANIATIAAAIAAITNTNTTTASNDTAAHIIEDLTFGFGTSLVQLPSLGKRAVAVGAPSADGGAGRLWLLRGLGADLSIPPNATVSAAANDTSSSSSSTSSSSTASSSTSSYPAVVLVDTSTLNLEPGDQFGSSVAWLSERGGAGGVGETASAGGGASSADFGADLDGDPATLDLAVGAPGVDVVDQNSGAVFVLFVDPLTGKVRQSFRVGNLNGVSYYNGGTLNDLLGRRDEFGSSVACLGDLSGNGQLELTVGVPGYSRSAGNSRGGAWITLFLNAVQPPSLSPTLEPTVTRTPTFLPSLVPSPQPSDTHSPTFPPSLLPSLLPTATLQPTDLPNPRPTARPSLNPTALPTPFTPAPTHPFEGFEPTVPVLTPTVTPSFQGSIGLAILAWFCVLTTVWIMAYSVKQKKKITAWLLP